jgi:SUN domain-containing protein 1/2
VSEPSEIETTLTSSESTVAPSPDHLLLASVEYDPSADDPTQTFPIPPAIIDLGVDIGIVIFKVESNWGGDLTCLYRVSFPFILKAQEMC